MNGLNSAGRINTNSLTNPGAVYAPGNIHLFPLPETPLIGNFEDQSGLIFIGIRSFGKEVLENFFSLCKQYNSGFDWRKIKIIMINADSLSNQESTCFSLSQTTFAANFSNHLMTLFPAWGNDASIKIVLISRLQDNSICSDVYKVISNIPKQYADRSAFISFFDTNKIGDTQKSALREFLHWQQRGWHEPDIDQREYLKDIYLFDQEDRNCVSKMGLTLFTRYYKDIRNKQELSNNQGNSPIFSNDVRGCGIPVELILDYHACKLTEELLFAVGGLFSEVSIDQNLVSQIIKDKSYAPILDRLSPLKSQEEYGNEVMLYLNDRTCAERWQRLYTALLFEQKRPNKQFVNNTLGLLNDFIVTNEQPGEVIAAIRDELLNRSKSIVELLKEKTTDPYLRWNIEKERVVTEAEKIVDLLDSNINADKLQKELGPHLQLHIGLKDSDFSILPVCIPARWEGGLISTDYEYQCPDQVAELVLSIWRLAREWVTNQFTNIPRLNSNGLRESDKNFLYEKDNLYLTECDNHQFEGRLLIANQDNETQAANLFNPGSMPSKIAWTETNLVITYKQILKDKAKLLDFLMERQSGPAQYSDEHLLVADKYESLYRQAHYDCQNSWCFCDDLILTFNNPEAVSVFWKAVDRGIISWNANQHNWKIKKVATYAEVEFKTSENHQKNIESLLDAYVQFTIEIPRELNDENGATYLPMHKKNRERYFQSLKNAISNSETNSEIRDWLKKEFIRSKNLQISDTRIRFIQDCYRLYTVARAG